MEETVPIKDKPTKRPPDPRMAGSPTKPGAPDKKKGKKQQLSVINPGALVDSPTPTDPISEFGTAASQSYSPDVISEFPDSQSGRQEVPSQRLTPKACSLPVNPKPSPQTQPLTSPLPPLPLTKPAPNPAPNLVSSRPPVHPESMSAADRAACPSIEYALCHLASGGGFPWAGNTLNETQIEKVKAAVNQLIPAHTEP
jgi:hypothetical protein